MVNIGVIGYGYWGPNIVRNFSSHKDCTVTAVCDNNPGALARVLNQYPNVRLMTNPDDIVRSPEIDAVAIVTPVSYHQIRFQANQIIHDRQIMWSEIPHHIDIVLEKP